LLVVGLGLEVVGVVVGLGVGEAVVIVEPAYVVIVSVFANIFAFQQSG
jgi:hypothetical protein